MRNEDKWHPDEDDEAADRLLGYGIVGAFFGLLILFVIASMAINQILWS
ncbi:hypothetical protein [Achromobacter animicus]|nr:hypothetical protein [Achromobacter animicus]